MTPPIESSDCHSGNDDTDCLCELCLCKFEAEWEDQDEETEN